MQVLNWADYLTIAIIVISTLISLIRGFVCEIMSLITWIIAFIIAFEFSGKLSLAFANYIQSQSTRLAIGFAIIFIVTLILGSLIGHFLSMLVSKGKIKGVDRTLGMIFGFMRGILVIAVILLLVSIGSPDHAKWWTESYLLPHFQGLVNWLSGFLPHQISSLQQATNNVVTNNPVPSM